MPEICQNDLPIKPWADDRLSRLPGLNPIGQGEWLIVDDAYTAQLAYKKQLLETHPQDVCRMADEAIPACEELLDLVLLAIDSKPGFSVQADHVTCPDGRIVQVDRKTPLQTCAKLVQEDLCVMQKHGDEHFLTAALLCFPASWSLDQKFMRPLTTIHDPVPSYDQNIAKRVQRLHDGIQVERPMWRANALTYSDPDLHQPRRTEARRKVDPEAPKWMRVERQGLRKLEHSQAVVFSIHTYVVPYKVLTQQDLVLLKDAGHATSGAAG